MPVQGRSQGSALALLGSPIYGGCRCQPIAGRRWGEQAGQALQGTVVGRAFSSQRMAIGKAGTWRGNNTGMVVFSAGLSQLSAEISSFPGNWDQAVLDCCSQYCFSAAAPVLGYGGL